MGKRKLHKLYTKQEIVNEYQGIRKKYGDKAKSSVWMIKNGFNWLYMQVNNQFESWRQFKKEAGFNDHDRRLRSKQELIDEYKEIRKKYGDKAKSCVWMANNGFGWLYGQVSTKFKSWHTFKREAGFKDKEVRAPSEQELIDEYKNIREKHGNKAKSSKWMTNNGFHRTPQQAGKRFGSWHEFKIASGFNDRKMGPRSKQELIEEYKGIRKKYGNKAKGCGWMYRNGFQWLYRQVKIKFGSWYAFKREAGFKDKEIRSFSKQGLIREYKRVRKKYGDKAKSSTWMENNGFLYLYCQASKKFKSWHTFKIEAGFKDKEVRSPSKQELTGEYKRVRKKYGDKAKSSDWVANNGFSWIPQQARKQFGSWHNFKTEAGFNDRKVGPRSKQELINKYKCVRKKHGDKAGNSVWIKENGFRWLYAQVSTKFKSWHNFKTEAGFDDDRRKPPKLYSKEELVNKYREIRAEHGDEAKSSVWMRRNGFVWLYSQAKRKFGSWKYFKRIAGEFCEPFTKEEVEI